MLFPDQSQICWRVSSQYLGSQVSPLSCICGVGSFFLQACIQLSHLPSADPWHGVRCFRVPLRALYLSWQTEHLQHHGQLQSERETHTHIHGAGIRSLSTTPDAAHVVCILCIDPGCNPALAREPMKMPFPLADRLLESSKGFWLVREKQTQICEEKKKTSIMLIVMV